MISLTAPGTRKALGGSLPQELHPSLVNDRKRRDIVHGAKAYIGVGIQGIRELREKQRSESPPPHIQDIIEFDGDGHIIIGMNSYLASLVHQALWIMVDTTFKAIQGKTNVWKLVIWSSQLNKRIVVGRVWTNRATRAAFCRLWNAIFDAVNRITKKKLTFRLFSRKAQLLCGVGDSEAAQAQGFADCILSRNLNDPAESGLPSFSADEILLYLWKTCLVHYIHGVLALWSYIETEELEYLKNFPHLSSNDEIETFWTFCESSKSPKIQAWWNHKTMYPWLLPSLNRHLTQMKKSWFDLAPNDSNAIEGSHVQVNQVNGIGRSMVEGVMMAEKGDSETARIIKQATQTGVLTKSNNTPQDRFTSNATRHEKCNQQAQESHARTSALEKIKTELAATQQRTKELREKAKLLKEQHLGLKSRRKCRQPLAGPSRHPDAIVISNNEESHPKFDLQCDFIGLQDGTFDCFLNDLEERDYMYSDPVDEDSAGRPLYACDSDEEILMSDPFSF
ncbi:hypothetical protein C8J56DRAFT_879912 [Mycena floridula]|nr:hypothetical protein C8J56DRAFT_879912 [Mycena floridula]